MDIVVLFNTRHHSEDVTGYLLCLSLSSSRIVAIGFTKNISILCCSCNASHRETWFSHKGCPKKNQTGQKWILDFEQEGLVLGGCPFHSLMYSWVHQTVKRTASWDKSFMFKIKNPFLASLVFFGTPFRWPPYHVHDNPDDPSDNTDLINFHVQHGTSVACSNLITYDVFVVLLFLSVDIKGGVSGGAAYDQMSNVPCTLSQKW